MPIFVLSEGSRVLALKNHVEIANTYMAYPRGNVLYLVLLEGTG